MSIVLIIQYNKWQDLKCKVTFIVLSLLLTEDPFLSPEESHEEKNLNENLIQIIMLTLFYDYPTKSNISDIRSRF